MLPARQPRSARWGALLIAGALVLSVPAPALASGGANKMEKRMLNLVNNARKDHGLSPVRMGASMRKKARRHSVRMSNRGSLFHTSCLSCVSPKPYRSLGENVAMAGTVRRAHQNLMRSSAHRRIILCGCFKRVGIGVVRRNGRVWVTQRYWG